MSLRTAASVLLTRGHGDDVEVYLVERSKRLSFFGGYLALPGGVVGAEDEIEHAGGDASLRSCAIRELFEETGVLLPPLAGRVEDHERDPLRERLLVAEAAPEAWQSLLGRGREVLESLQLLCTMTTPEFAPVRYETTFFHAELPLHEWPTVVGGELVDGEFMRPGEAVRRWLEGEILIVPPVLLLLRLLDTARVGSFYGVVRREAETLRTGRLHPVFFTPGVLLAPLRTPTLPPATTTNAYLVGNRRFFVVDPATWEKSEQERLFALVDEWRAEGRELGGILATHHHADHVGAIAPMSRRYGIPVYGHPLTLERLPGARVEGRPIGDGDRLELDRGPDGSEDWHLRVLHTPGHDRGHLAFLESRYGAAIVGDLCSTVSTVVIDPPEGHLATYLASLRRLLAEPITTLYPAHGPARRDGHGLISEYLVHRQEREEALVQELGAKPRPVASLVPPVYRDVDPSLHPLAARSLLAGLIKLEEEGRARRVGGEWVRA